MVQPKQSDITQAKEYLRRRLAAEVSMEHYLDRKLLAAAREIISLAYGRRIPPTLFSFEYDPFLSAEVTNIINALVDEIEEYNILVATMTDREDKGALVPYIYREIDGATYRDRLNLYGTKFKLELQHFIAAQMMLGFSKTDTSQHIAAEYKHLKEGKGYASYPRLLTLTRHTIADAWMHEDCTVAKNPCRLYVTIGNVGKLKLPFLNAHLIPLCKSPVRGVNLAQKLHCKIKYKLKGWHLPTNFLSL